MELQYGEITKVVQNKDGSETIVNNVYARGEKTSYYYYKVREVVKDDQEELAQFIKFQRESKGSKEASFTREVSKIGRRYVIKCWRE